ncbi:hypothetical protein [Streptomyces montanisoli]|uniref:Uncharacterized protein n=1 Tax=Streptomyces montanisoli TaxID=2798581 RepID=A0A940M7X3_9ACTN|nr:hypothetical protein [Streptomyces montanisoli]MBP0456424.1 hypothetical protein [Streptomyces montanisoli]
MTGKGSLLDLLDQKAAPVGMRCFTRHHALARLDSEHSAAGYSLRAFAEHAAANDAGAYQPRLEQPFRQPRLLIGTMVDATPAA